MKIHVFNPEHDIALAAGTPLFTAPRAGRQLRSDLGFLPALWADDGDVVVVDDIHCLDTYSPMFRELFANVEFVGWPQLSRMDVTDAEVDVWGWDAVICRELVRANPAFAPLLPGDDRMENIRRMSNRRFAAENLLPQLLVTDERLTGQAEYVDDVAAVADRLASGSWVLKSPWSSSGRGVRFFDQPLTEQQKGWCRNVIEQQGGIMLEPKYNNVCDFAMEFFSDGRGGIDYLGLSVFTTTDGGYTGNLVADERMKVEILSEHVETGLVYRIRDKIADALSASVGTGYRGVFGVDMMIVEEAEVRAKKIVPCVELNLRRTMGHVALAMAGNGKVPIPCLMNIYYSGGRYSLNFTF